MVPTTKDDSIWININNISPQYVVKKNYYISNITKELDETTFATPYLKPKPPDRQYG